MTPRFRQRAGFGRHRFATWFIFVFAGGTVAGWAEAQDPETLIRKGIEHRRADRNLDALKLFQQAYDLQETPRALAQIGMAEQALGKWGAADRHLRRAIESADDPWIRKNRAPVDSALRVIGGHVGRLDVTGTPTGAEVRVDGELIGRLPFSAPVSVTAGGVAIEVRAPGYLPIVRAATVSVGVMVRESFDLQSLSPTVESVRQVASSPGSGASTSGAGRGSTPSPSNSTGPVTDATTPPTNPNLSSPTSSDTSEGSSPGVAGTSPDHLSASDGVSVRRVVTYGFAGLAVAALAVGIVEHVTWQKKVGSFEDMVGCDARVGMRGGTGCQQLYNEGESAKKIALVGYGLGAGLAVTAAILYFTEPVRASEPTKVACAVNLLTPGMGCRLSF